MTERIVQTIRTVPELRDQIAARRAAGATVGFVPTMGALHNGHCALIERAAREHDVVVVSIFVNPTQFNQAEDLEQYPRDEQGDVNAAVSAGATICFVPSVDEIYPQNFATTVQVRGPLTETLEGQQRGVGHFDGMATVVTILLNVVAPDVVYFGAKDAQQALVVRRFTADLQIPIEVVTADTVRDADGLALSSRNARLSAGGREQALAISAALQAAADAISDGSASSPEAAQTVGTDRLREAAITPEYFAITDPSTLEPARQLSGTLLIACAATVDGVRLIDNLTVIANREAATATR
jgi:pantoate--beta-alanine ligase